MMIPRVLVATLVPLAALAQAQTTKLLKDINTTPYQTWSYPRPMAPQAWTGMKTFAQLGKVILLSARSQALGNELWVSNGTSAGTKLLKDIYPGVDSSHPRRVRVTNDGKRAFFSADDGKGWELWVTDGTTTGTRLVRDIASGIVSSNPDELVAFGPSSVVFRAFTRSAGTELWISDGSSAGTTLLKDIWPGVRPSTISYLRATKDGKKVFFSADNGTNGDEIWVTDGTSAGTVLLRDIKPGRWSSSPRHLTPLGSSKVLFHTNLDLQLWISDGTRAGTKRALSSAQTGILIASTQHALALGNKVIFRALSAIAGMEPYITDGTSKGTVRLIDANPGAASGSMFYPHLDSTGKKVYWSSQTGSGSYRIFVTDGTPSGTRVFTPKNLRHYATSMAESRGKVYFEAFNFTSSSGSELCISDGSLAGTKILRDTWPGRQGGSARYLTRFERLFLFYTADNGVNGNELWMGVDGKSFVMFDINNPRVAPTHDSRPYSAIRFGRHVVFSATDGKAGAETWITDGTSAGTRMLKDLIPGSKGAKPGLYAAVGDKVVFIAHTLATGIELFVTDGTASGTKLLKDIRRGSQSSSPTELRSIGGKVYFNCDDGSSGREPWITDGTPSGTKILQDIRRGKTSSDPRYFAGQGSQVVFQAHSSSAGTELFITDGTSSGTRLLKDIHPGFVSSKPQYMTYNAGKVYFMAYTSSTGFELWNTDFTNKGTVLVKDIYPGILGSYPSYLAARDGRVFFQADTAATGKELFTSDGSSAGTRLFLDYVPGRAGSSPTHITAVGSRKVYFTTETYRTGKETVVTDGTSSGTRLIDLWPGRKSGNSHSFDYPNYRITLGSKVLVSGRHPIPGWEVFLIDNGATAEPLGTPHGSTWIHGSDPVLGKMATIAGGTSLANAVHVTLYGSLAARPTRLAKAGFAHFDTKNYFGITGVTQGANFRLALPVPSSPSLKGVQVVFQTLSFDTNNLTKTLELSNGLHWVIGN